MIMMMMIMMMMLLLSQLSQNKGDCARLPSARAWMICLIIEIFCPSPQRSSASLRRARDDPIFASLRRARDSLKSSQALQR